MKKNVVAFPTPAPAIDAQLRSAIANKRLVEFTYNNQRRVAEPHDYGQRNGIDQLLIYQRKKAGKYITGWRSLEVSKIDALVVLDDTFRGSRGEPRQDHIAWDVLYARVE
jgi:hypothetical protein